MAGLVFVGWVLFPVEGMACSKNYNR